MNLEKYMLLANIDTSKATSDSLFKPVVKVKSGLKIIQKVLAVESCVFID